MVLTPSLLRQFEERLRGSGAPVVEQARPGLTEREIEAIQARAGLRLPLEARRWWGWRNGIATATVGDVVPLREWIPLERAVEEHVAMRAWAREESSLYGDVPHAPELGDPDHWWWPSWLPITRSFGRIVLDVSGDHGDRCPVHVVDFEQIEEAHTARTASLGQLVAWWIESFDAGAFRWDGDWQVDFDLLPAPLRASGL